MKNYKNALGAGLLFGGLLVCGSVTPMFLPGEFALKSNPEARPVLEKIVTEKRNQAMIQMTVDNTENILACMQCYSESNPEEARVLTPSLTKFNDWNKSALASVNSKIEVYEKNPVMVDYENSKKNIMT